MVKPMRVALAGAHGTGKTTLARSLVERLNRLEIRANSLPEAPREICGRAGDPVFFRRGSNKPLRQSLILLLHLMQEFNFLSNEVDVVISDRSLLDHWIYALYLFEKEWTEEGVKDLYESFIVDHCRIYDLVFFVPIEFTVLDDGTREGDREFQAGIQALMLDIMAVHKIAALEVRGSVEERTDYCAKMIQTEIAAGKKGGAQ